MVIYCENCGNTEGFAMWDLICSGCGWGSSKHGSGYMYNTNAIDADSEYGIKNPRHENLRKAIQNEKNGGPPVRISHRVIFNDTDILNNLGREKRKYE